jgi:SPP1 family predicted phage head-tail adaptor
MAFRPNVKPQIGEFCNRVAIEQATTTKNSFGEDIETWSHVCYVWASVTPFNSKEKYYLDQWQFEETLSFTIRWQLGLNDKQRIVYNDGNGDRYYNIRGIERVGRNRWVNLIAQYKA